MRQFTILMLTLVGLAANAQSEIQYNLSKREFQKTFVFDLGTGVPIKFIESKAKDPKAKYAIEVFTTKQDSTKDKFFELRDNFKLNLATHWKLDSVPGKLLHGEVSITDSVLLSTFLLTAKGEIIRQKRFGKKDQRPAGDGKSKDVVFVNPDYLQTISTTAVAKPTNRITYNPCKNNWTLSGAGLKNEGIEYSVAKDAGIALVIEPINTLKYDMAVTKSFEIRETEAPGLITGLFDNLKATGGNALAAKDADGGKDDDTPKLREELKLILQLNTQLKQFLSTKSNSVDCGDMANYGDQKKDILSEIEKPSRFPGLQIAIRYKPLKDSYMASNTVDAEKFNEEVKKKYKLKVTPDELVTETTKLVNTLVQTSFSYQYNIPQVQNAEALVFDISIKPKEGSNGGIHMTNETLRLPIRGSFNIEASTGFYTTGSSNEVFSLTNNYAMITDSVGNVTTRFDSITSKTISQDRKRDASTLGAAAFIHPSWRAGKDLRLMGALGLGTSPNLNYSILLGGGFMLGQKNRIGVFAGLSINNVKELSRKYTGDDGNFLPQGTEVTGLDMTNTFVNDSFFSITYSFGFKKAQKAADSASSSEGDEKKKEGE